MSKPAQIVSTLKELGYLESFEGNAFAITDKAIEFFKERASEDVEQYTEDVANITAKIIEVGVPKHLLPIMLLVELLGLGEETQ